jgi:diaminohydroxyphosphoribosylaminopyrimidine deaminase/5-amino-6-(5-phosphoribosylamino)uracil reductase
MAMNPFMKEAFNIAKTADFMRVRPNPMVGAVVVSEKGLILGKGCHEQFGLAHAEVNAINDALCQQSDLTDCVLYVTLEPCSHQGKTPPCTSLIQKHGIKKVVIGTTDPNPLVGGVEVLKNAGIDVEVNNYKELIELNREFFINQRRKRPYISLKMAMTIDGKIADRFGNSKWLSNEESRNHVHEKLRPAADAILTTYQTILKDDARLNIRKSDGTMSDKNILIIDRNFTLLETENAGLSLFQAHPNSIIYLFGNRKEIKKVPKNVQVIFTDFDQDGNINLDSFFNMQLGLKHYHILVEAGGKLATQLMLNNYIDEMNLFIAPKALIDSKAKGLFGTEKIISISDLVEFELSRVSQYDNDLFICYQRRIGADI